MKTITLEKPIVRGKDDKISEITEIALRKPASGELRGIVLSDLLKMHADATMAVLPRICEPKLTPPEVAAMDPADLFACAVEISNFLLPTSTQPADASTQNPESPAE
ncbi:phage tail assembly protein [Denitromonas iodatirespirans]|uniref:Phage tail assembly protein n=1 Tax=Denitromonas iodatirespirans TaxID=2795389 RepID=A0A944DAC6_DENI1|nr:phage tail assembly protein [Denitromonas iodatirespirans]MBT0961677.1 phage tail assembly protein [Denitromonas iodatirespirans]